MSSHTKFTDNLRKSNSMSNYKELEVTEESDMIIKLKKK